jgi:hypothetical protein
MRSKLKLIAATLAVAGVLGGTGIASAAAAKPQKAVADAPYHCWRSYGRVYCTYTI